MTTSAWVDPRIDRLSVEQMRSYLSNQGWHLQAYPGSELLVFSEPNDDEGEPIIQVLPSSARLRDYRMRIEGLIGASSAIETSSRGGHLDGHFGVCSVQRRAGGSGPESIGDAVTYTDLTLPVSLDPTAHSL